MGWHLAALVIRPLVRFLRQDPLPMASVAAEFVNQTHVLAVGFSDELDYSTDEPKSVISGRESQHRRSWPSAGTMAWPKHENRRMRTRVPGGVGVRGGHSARPSVSHAFKSQKILASRQIA